MKMYWGSGGIVPRLLDLGTGWKWVVSFTPRPLYPQGKSPGTHWIGGWVGPRAILDTVVKRKILSPHRKSNSRTSIIQPVANCYTDWVITAVLRNKCLYIYDDNGERNFYIWSTNLTSFRALGDWYMTAGSQATGFRTLSNVFCSHLCILWYRDLNIQIF
jgi:hypothetical protein